MLEDAELIHGTESYIRQNLAAEKAFDVVMNEWRKNFSRHAQPMVRERVGDLTDVHIRVLTVLLGLPDHDPVDVPKGANAILVTHDLTPSLKHYVYGLVDNQVAEGFYAHWLKLARPNLDDTAGCHALVADFAADLPDEWEAFLADAAPAAPSTGEPIAALAEAWERSLGRISRGLQSGTNYLSARTRFLQDGALEVTFEVMPEFHAALDELRGEWRQDALIHGDMKWDNCVMPRHDDPARAAEGLKIVDWELADIGDGCWDVGAVFQAYLAHWILTMRIPAEQVSPDHLLDYAEFPLDRMQEYAYHKKCRRKYVMDYFGDTSFRKCAGCDNCRHVP